MILQFLTCNSWIPICIIANAGTVIRTIMSNYVFQNVKRLMGIQSSCGLNWIPEKKATRKHYSLNKKNLYKTGGDGLNNWEERVLSIIGISATGVGCLFDLEYSDKIWLIVQLYSQYFNFFAFFLARSDPIRFEKLVLDLICLLDSQKENIQLNVLNNQDTERHLFRMMCYKM